MRRPLARIRSIEGSRLTDASATRFEPIAISSESTVVAEFVPDSANSVAHQSEAELEREFIRLLQGQAYEYVTIRSEAELLANLRVQLEALNTLTFTDDEWQRLLAEYVVGANDGAVQKTVRVQEDHVYAFRREDGSTKNIALIDKKSIHNNRLQVINQYEVAAGGADAGGGIEVGGGGRYANRYDVTILVNGLPLVHVELKRRGVDIREAFNQIDRYQRDSFWAGSGLFDYVQLFVISNGTLTKYYSNTTRRQHIDDASGPARTRKSSNSFEFTSWWADAANTPIRGLVGFTKTFFAKHTLLAILTRYCVLTGDRQLMVMRPYQIVATERILQRIEVATNYKKLGTTAAGGYVWHTTGSGKTLTSFKAAQLASRLPSVDKVLFVVDRKDLDWQTQKEYDRFEKGSANASTSTAMLSAHLADPERRIVITTIQKLARLVQSDKGHSVYDGHVVLIFDECHRSQFGDMHSSITKAFKRYNLFGFTGTPIFAENAGSGGNPQLKTTEQAFGEKLHTYTIVDAITDKNVLPFRIDYVNTIKVNDGLTDKQVSAIDTERALLDPTRIGIIYSFAANEAEVDGFLEEESFDTMALDLPSRQFLDEAISDYNTMFGTQWSTSSDGFAGYYTDLSMRLKNREIDVVIVVNMFLTGFDATTLNTLWVDKNLRSHGLIQAYSRTNRILNSVKTYGNIVSFRDLEQQTNDAIALFGNKNAKGVVVLKPYGEYDTEYAARVTELLDRFLPGQQIMGEQQKREFVALLGAILRLQNILTSFDDFEGNEILTERQMQDYRSEYLNIYAEIRRPTDEKESINDDILFEIDLIKQVEITVDYILLLVQKYRDERGDGDDREVRAEITRAIDASPSLRNKKDLIEAFVERLSVTGSVDDEWGAFVAARQDAELTQLIADEGLNPDATRDFIDRAFRDGTIQTTGVAITRVLPPVSRFTPGGDHGEKKQRVLDRFSEFFERYFGLG